MTADTRSSDQACSRDQACSGTADPSPSLSRPSDLPRPTSDTTPVFAATVAIDRGAVLIDIAGSAALGPSPILDIVVPVYNEEVDLEPSVRRLRAYLDEQFGLPSLITIADNASTDATWLIAQRLVGAVPGLRALHLDEKGRGRALKQAWLSSEAPIVAYTDVDLSTDLDALLSLVAPLLSGHSQVAIGSRLARGARVRRGLKREVISRTYNIILRSVLRAGFRDAQCGFKAIRADAARFLLPLVEDPGWFFDTELLVRAERADLRVHEVPVDWVDDPDTRVSIVSTALADLRGVARLLRDRRRPTVPAALGRDRVGTENVPLVGRTDTGPDGRRGGPVPTR